MCKLLLHPYNLLILDEPTNHLDIRSKEVLKEALRNYDGTLIVVSHDRDFLSGMTELVYEVTPRGLKQYIGDIQQFLHEKHASSIRAYEAGKAAHVGGAKAGEVAKDSTGQSAKSHADTATPAPASAKSSAERKAQEKELKRLQNQVQQLEKRIAEKEGELAELSQSLAEADPSDRTNITRWTYAYAEVEAQLQQAMQDWTTAVEAVERCEASK